SRDLAASNDQYSSNVFCPLRSPKLIRKVSGGTVFMECLHSFGVIGSAELDHALDDVLRIDQERIGDFFALAGVSELVFTAPSIGPLRSDLFEPQPDGGNSQVVRCLGRVFQFASVLST